MNLGIFALTLPLLAANPMAPPPPPTPSPFTYVKVLGPQGTTTIWHPATPLAVTVANDELVALRTGYCYRFRLSKKSDLGETVLWPSIEVRGSLIRRPDMNFGDHPIPIIFSDDDISLILQGRFVSRVYYLEDPDQAINGPVPLGVPFETNAVSEMEALKEARRRGRVMIIVRAGERQFTPDELAHENVPGTIWTRSMRAVPIPVAPPLLGCCEYPFDPLLGPRELTGECLYDGGDRNFNLGIGRGGALYGLDPSDTAIEYTTPWGRKVCTSNRVCICVPRFAAMRVEMGIISQQGISGPHIHEQLNPQKVLVKNLPPIAVGQFEQPVDRIGSSRPSGLLMEQGPALKEALALPAAVANLNGVRIAAQVREPEELTLYNCKLILVKRMDPPHPKRIGELVTFYLTYTNPTSEPMTDVVVSDSLTARLEYIEGTAKSDRAATFTNSPNEANSLVLRWAIDGKLLPGHMGTVSFVARIK